MAEETKPMEAVSQPKPEATTTTSTKVEAKKSNSALPKILIILVVVLCACVLCAGVAYFAFINFVGKTVSTINSAVVNEVMNAAYNSSSNTTANSTGNTTNSTSNSTGNFSFGTTVPSTFPSDVPIYSGATASFSSSDTNSDGKPETSVTFALKGKASDVVNFYKAQMGSAGYTLKSEVNFFGNVMTFDNSKREVIVSVIGSDTESDVVLSIVATDK